MISARTAAGLKAAKRRGTKLGMAWKSEAEAQAIAERGVEANKAAALGRLNPLGLSIADALREGCLPRAAAGRLNARNVMSPGGGRWHAPSLLKAALRLGLRKQS